MNDDCSNSISAEQYSSATDTVLVDINRVC